MRRPKNSAVDPLFSSGNALPRSYRGALYGAPRHSEQVGIRHRLLAVRPQRQGRIADGICWVERIKWFRSLFAEHDRATLAEMLENFHRDDHPEREVEIWERAAFVYSAFVRRYPDLTQEQRKQVYGLCLGACPIQSVLSPAAQAELGVLFAKVREADAGNPM